MLVADMTAPVLFASYSGLLGGAERVLLDCAARLPRPAVIACPEGALADAARAAGLRHAVADSWQGLYGRGERTREPLP